MRRGADQRAGLICQRRSRRKLFGLVASGATEVMAVTLGA
jgi:hypothetical protein